MDRPRMQTVQKNLRCENAAHPLKVMAEYMATATPAAPQTSG